MRYDLFYKKFEYQFKTRNVKPKMILKIYTVFIAIPHKVETICIGDGVTNRLSKNDCISFHFDNRVVSVPISYFKNKNWFYKIIKELRNDTI